MYDHVISTKRPRHVLEYNSKRSGAKSRHIEFCWPSGDLDVTPVQCMSITSICQSAQLTSHVQYNEHVVQWIPRLQHMWCPVYPIGIGSLRLSEQEAKVVGLVWHGYRAKGLTILVYSSFWSSLRQWPQGGGSRRWLTSNVRMWTCSLL